ncbi:MAG: hypothetical protein DI539_21385 [Flavobacterium psychrophilum]|nr:MAG: hypothetical protein DI539_21385 [Flavobacterium psychrophilum]
MRPPDLYLHVDKQVYSPNENIWFTAYLMGHDTLTSPVLYCLLVAEPSRKIVLADRFIIKGDFAGGALFLPDSLKAGQYRLLAYTQPAWSAIPGQHVFQQALTIKKPDSTTFKWSFLPVDDTRQEDTVRFGYKIITSYGGLATHAKVDYTILVDGTAVTSRSQITNAFGEIKLALSRQSILGRSVELRANITRKQDKLQLQQQVDLVVPLLPRVIKARLFPEGGKLVHHRTAALGMELKDGQGIAVAVRGDLMENGIPIRVFTTDQYGLGKVTWAFDVNKLYTLRLEDTSRILLYDFPPITPAGYSLHIPEGVSTDTGIAVEIGVPFRGDTCHVILHDYRSVIHSVTLVVNNQQAILHIPETLMQQGVATLTLFDAAGHPKAERAVYKPFSDSLQMTVTLDSSDYHTRSRVRLKVKVANSKGQPVEAFFSTACVLGTRLDLSTINNINRFYRFDRYLPAPANLPPVRHLEDRENIERLLLTRYWTNYLWNNIEQATQSIPTQQPPCDVGNVRYKEAALKEPIRMMVIGGVSTQLFETDQRGGFVVQEEWLDASAGQKVVIMPVTGNKSIQYRVALENHCTGADSLLAAQRYPEAYMKPAEWSVQEQQLMKRSLAAVVVTAKTYDDQIYTGVAGSKADCNEDYVCMNEILNCPIHRSSTIKPVNGRSYYIWSTRQREIYQCGAKKEPTGDFVKELTSVKYPKEFYVADYSSFNPGMPETETTVFWSYQSLTDAQGEADLTFFTNDLRGTFHCILQGFSGKGPVSGKAIFKVVE